MTDWGSWGWSGPTPSRVQTRPPPPLVKQEGAPPAINRRTPSLRGTPGAVLHVDPVRLPAGDMPLIGEQQEVVRLPRRHQGVDEPGGVAEVDVGTQRLAGQPRREGEGEGAGFGGCGGAERLPKRLCGQKSPKYFQAVQQNCPTFLLCNFKKTACPTKLPGGTLAPCNY